MRTPRSPLLVHSPRRPPSRWQSEDDISLMDVVRCKSRAWKLTMVAGAEVAALEARRRVAVAAAQTEAAELEVMMQQERLLANHNVSLTRLAVERDRLRRELSLPAPPPAAIALPAPGMQVDLSDQQIEALALRAISRMGDLSGAEAEEAWATWRKELKKRFPENLAAEIERKAASLRSLAR